jgi:hypothetical protein
MWCVDLWWWLHNWTMVSCYDAMTGCYDAMTSCYVAMAACYVALESSMQCAARRTRVTASALRARLGDGQLQNGMNHVLN